MSVAFQDVLLHTVFTSHAGAILLAVLFGGVISTLTYIGNGHPKYSQSSRIGEGLLLPWLLWKPPTRWRLHEIEVEGYQKVRYFARYLPQTRRR